MAGADDVAAAAAPFDVDVLDVIREAQGQHGLRQDDYDRYRSYCSRKIRRLRGAAGLQQGKGRKYAFKPVTADNAVSLSALLVLLFQAERDWSHAQALKQDVTEEPRKRFHLIKRLRRAAAHARALEAVCTALGDRVTPRTLLDVQAYAHYLDGLVHLETQQWEAALDAMIRARALLTRLAATGTPQQAALCNARIEEVDPSIRYSAYNLGQLTGGGDERELAALIRQRLKAAGDENTAWAELVEQLDGGAAKPGAGVQEIRWGGQAVPVRNAKVAQLFASIDALRTEARAAASAGDASAIFDKLLAACGEAVSATQDDVKADEAAAAKAKSAKSQENTAQLRAVHTYASFLRLQCLSDRAVHLIAQTLQRLPGETGAGAAATAAAKAARAGKQRPAKLEDVVHQYDQLMQNWTDIGALPGVDQDAALARTAEGRVLLYRSFRLHYAGRLNEASSLWPQALALYIKSDEVLAKAQQLLSASGDAKAVAEEAARLTKLNRGRKAIVKAGALIADRAPAPTGAASPAPAAAAAPATVAVEHRLDEPVVLDGADLAQLHLVDLPPAFEAAPVKPVFFDIAENHLEPPSLSHRYETGGGSGGLISGLLSGWWGGGKK